MNKNKLNIIFSILIITFVTIFSFSVSYATEAQNLLYELLGQFRAFSIEGETAFYIPPKVVSDYNIRINYDLPGTIYIGDTVYSISLRVNGQNISLLNISGTDGINMSSNLTNQIIDFQYGEYDVVLFDVFEDEETVKHFDAIERPEEEPEEEESEEDEPEEQEPEDEGGRPEVIDTSTDPSEKKESVLSQASALEMTISEMCLAVGDHLMEYLTFLLSEEVTIDKIIFNKVDALNANFFENSKNPSDAPATKFIREAVNYWYAFLGKIVIIIYMIALIAVGIMILLGGVSRKVEAKDILMKWTMGIIIFYFFPYVMRYAFDINEALIGTIAKTYMSDSAMGSYIGGKSDLTREDLEERSPEYVTKASFLLTLGSEEATEAYIESLDSYSEKADLMRIMRALAGVTARMLYVILWYIMIFQLLIFIYIYYKRYLMIAFLIMVFPVTLISYVMGTVATGKVSSISSWCKEFFTNVFLQSIHAIIYGIITGVIVNQIRDALATGDATKINWLLWICVINFIFTGEKIIKGIMNAGGAESVKDIGDVAHTARGGARKGIGKIGSMFK